jgi:hypothetical protein
MPRFSKLPAPWPVVSIDEALQVIQSGQKVAIGLNANAPNY